MLADNVTIGVTKKCSQGIGKLSTSMGTMIEFIYFNTA